MIKVYPSETQGREFYADMGRFFADLSIAKELERQVYNKPDTTWYVAQQWNLIYGFVSVNETKNYYFIDNFYIIPEWRGQNRGSELIEHIVEDFTDKPLKCVANNPAAIHIFKSCGFVEDGHNGKYTRLIKY